VGLGCFLGKRRIREVFFEGREVWKGFEVKKKKKVVG